MNKITILSIVAAVVLFTGCGDKSKEAATDATAKAVASTKEAANHVADTAKEASNKAVDAVKVTADKVADVAKETSDSVAKVASNAVDSAKKDAMAAVATTTAAVADTAKSVAGVAAYAKCAGCHGVDGKTKALGKSAVIAGQSKEELVTKLNAYKAGTRDEADMGTLMKGQIAPMSDADIEVVSEYVSNLK